MKGTCDVCGRYCDRVINTDGYKLCTKHYGQYKKHGKFMDNNPRTIYDRNEYHICGDITYIDLYNKDCEVIGQAIIDTKDLDKVKDIKWKLSKSGYAMNTPKGSVADRGPNRHMSRIIYGEDKLTPELYVDHINHNTLDNRKCNLRAATKSENAMNSISLGKEGSNTVPGVYEKSSNRFSAIIKYQQYTIYLGTFDSHNEAAFARWIAEYLLFGDFRYKKSCPKVDPDTAWFICRKVVNLILDYGLKKIDQYYAS